MHRPKFKTEEKHYFINVGLTILLAYNELTAAQIENSDSDQLSTSAAAVSPISPDVFPNRSPVVKHPTMGAPGVRGVTCTWF